MQIESDATRLAMLKAVGGEEFATGYTSNLWGVFDREFYEAVTGEALAEVKVTTIEGRTSDVALHRLIKSSVITRVLDGVQYSVKRFKDDGTGMTRIELRE